MNHNTTKLGVVVPLANEEDNIESLLGRILVHLGPSDKIFCVLDKMSRDRTRAIIEHYALTRDARCLVVWAPENRCVVDAYFRGYRAAYDSGYQWILEMDGGFSHLPEEISRFLNAMKSGYDYAGGSRFMLGGSHASPISRRVISFGGTVLAKIFLASPMTDMTSGFECFSREAMKEVLDNGVMSRANFFQTEIRHRMSRRRWIELPITYSNDKPTIGRSSIRESFRILFSLSIVSLKDALSLSPLRTHYSTPLSKIV